MASMVRIGAHPGRASTYGPEGNIFGGSRAWRKAYAPASLTSAASASLISGSSAPLVQAVDDQCFRRTNTEQPRLLCQRAHIAGVDGRIVHPVR